MAAAIRDRASGLERVTGTKCGGEICVVAFINHAMAVCEILAYLGEPTSAPSMAQARGPPLWARHDGGQDEYDPQTQPAPDYEFDQRIAW
jgi:hypothetical protein